MKTQLLIIKDNQGYIRFTANDFEHCEMNKASVFPISQAEEVKRKIEIHPELKHKDAKIFLLAISEEEFRG